MEERNEIKSKMKPPRAPPNVPRNMIATGLLVFTCFTSREGSYQFRLAASRIILQSTKPLIVLGVTFEANEIQVLLWLSQRCCLQRHIPIGREILIQNCESNLQCLASGTCLEVNGVEAEARPTVIVQRRIDICWRAAVTQ